MTHTLPNLGNAKTTAIVLKRAFAVSIKRAFKKSDMTQGSAQNASRSTSANPAGSGLNLAEGRKLGR
jgi:hypothetical protein